MTATDPAPSPMSTVFKHQYDTSHLQGANATYVEWLYEQYLAEPGSVPAEWRSYFSSLGPTSPEVPHGPIVQAVAERLRKRNGASSRSCWSRGRFHQRPTKNGTGKRAASGCPSAPGKGSQQRGKQRNRRDERKWPRRRNDEMRPPTDTAGLRPERVVHLPHKGEETHEANSFGRCPCDGDECRRFGTGQHDSITNRHQGRRRQSLQHDWLPAARCGGELLLERDRREE